MKIIRIWQMAALAAVMAAGTAMGGGPDAKDIPADAKAYVHFDTSLLRDSRFLKAFREEMGASNPVDKGLNDISMVAGVHLLEDMDGLTFYSPTLAEGEGVLLMYGKVNADAVLKHVEAFPQHIAQPYGDHSIHSWFDQGRHATVAGMVSEKMIMWADSVERMKTALDVVDGKKEGKYALAEDFPKGAMFGAGVSDMKGFAKKPDQWILLLAKSVHISLSEDKSGVVKAIVTAGMADAEEAGQLRKVAEGLQAFAALNKEKLPGVDKLVSAVKIETEGARARASLERPAEGVFADIKTIQRVMGKGKGKEQE